MKNIKRILLVAVLVPIVAVVLLFVSTFINHNFIIRMSLTSDFEEIITENTDFEIIDSESTHGKLCGNGNGINFFGSVVVKTNSEEELKKLLPLLDEKFEIVGYQLQKGNKIDSPLIENTTLEYDASLDERQTYYTIYYFNGSHEYSYDFDIRGH